MKHLTVKKKETTRDDKKDSTSCINHERFKEEKVEGRNCLLPPHKRFTVLIL